MTKNTIEGIQHHIEVLQPRTISELIKEIRFCVTQKYEIAVKPVFYYGYLQGYKVVLTWIENDKARSCTLPRGKVYSIFQ